MSKIKSQAQLRRIQLLFAKGEITKEKFDEYMKGVDTKELPERVSGEKPKDETKWPLKERWPRRGH